MTTQMKIGLYANDIGGYFIGAWRSPEARREVEAFEHHLEQARRCEAAKLDCIFYADAPMLGDGPYGMGFYEPVTLLAGIATRTTNIGLAATQTTAFDAPYHVARRFASLDQLSGGRAAWNVVTGNSALAGKNFNDAPFESSGERYAQADEFVDVVTGLWDTWEEDALIRDSASGVYVRPDGVHPLNHRGRFYQVEGALSTWRPPQGHPVVIVAGGSIGARTIAAKHADVMFTVQSDLDAAVAFRDDMRGMVADAGRSPDDLKIMPGLAFVIGDTEADARRRLGELSELGDPEDSLSMLSERLEFDLRGFDLDGPLPEGIESKHLGGYPVNILNMARKHNLTIRELRDLTAASRSHHFICGTAEQIADGMTEWFTRGGCDGFNIMPAVNPTDLHGFLDGVVPILQARGLFRTEYEGSTMRENLGLPRVPSAHAVAR